ncbi:ABC transporter permease subunit [Iocasia frigidifontis]|uniref:ABC transporter permease subunit n=1 Tax=Iocasia fonsfrigidae TaxID=2682810 RepID=A0A8A7K443_9FIRM|nr:MULTISPECIES: amino acid ABC transporter permease [Halanaerobiaceae]AZO93623.1 amino acid ABC transporter permease [Halocella sp. SP3-1]QTL96493.1 ABC transporter permease subunit [Iocasia fonsfrigidae]
MLDIFNLFLEYYPRLMNGLLITIVLTVISIFLGTIFGVLLALGKIYGNKIVSRLITIFIGLIRGTPLLCQLFILYFGLPPYGIRLPALLVAAIGFTINSGCYQAEYLRGAIQSVSGCQMKAARSIGMTQWQGIIYVILPQALRRVIPSWANEFIYLLKYTSLAYIIGAPELMGEGKVIASRNYEFFKMYLIIAIIYLIIVLILTKAFDYLEERVKIPGLEHSR